MAVFLVLVLFTLVDGLASIAAGETLPSFIVPPTALLTRISSAKLVGFPSSMSPFILRAVIKTTQSGFYEPFSSISYSDVDENCSDDQKPEFHPC